MSFPFPIDVTNELLGRIAKLEEVVNDLASKSNNSNTNQRNIRSNHNVHHQGHHRNQGDNVDNDDNVLCVSYNIPSPHRNFSSGRSSPLTYQTTLHDIDNAINLDNYNPGGNVATNIDGDGDDDIQNDFSDSVESIDSDDPTANADDENEGAFGGGGGGGGRNNRHHSPVRRRNDSVTYDPQMSPVYGSSVVYAGQPRGRRETRSRHNQGGGRQDHRSRSPPNTNNRQGLTRRVTNSTTASSGRNNNNTNNNRRHHHQNNYIDDEDYDGSRGGGSQTNAMVDDGLVLRIGVSNRVSDSSPSVSSSSTDSDTD